MTPASDCLVQLARMEEARRQIQRQLDLIDRQITRRMTAMIPQLKPKRTGYRRGKVPDPSAFLERYRSHLAAITAERQPEIDALSRKLARQDALIEAHCLRHGFARDRAAAPHQSAPGPVDRAALPPRSQKEYDHG
ncbi:hypothetical protein [Bradyrhizobium sp. LA2.1]|uniref:hypothetical protein n=1 Tax=Bradyrhizobium sp. LA2.1 TaxID=3156376 RepID=UPI0033932C1B